ncbi:J domain-containing protein [Cohnella rhizosphaerae]|uniref:J domain-containing protein n=1 Tax=Cohnella rhizosphaerae TaxID=1457232 RepID=A0A9X4KNV8_9BACL|nr:J domain-containing protein [Cohnella rhizosphaerae]MDG0808369.1 J domain-containing protein [Cohnella rhizosphaerae]
MEEKNDLIKLKQAYAELGLPEDAHREALDNRYYVLMRRARTQKMREHGEAPAGERVDEDKVNAAYRFIKDFEEAQAKDAYARETYGSDPKKAARAVKRAHFFHYYKLHILGAIVLLIAIGYGIKSYVDHRHEQAELAKLPPVDVSVMFFGNYLYGDGINPDMTNVEADILKQFPDWKRVVAGLTYVPAETRSEQDMALLQKSMLVLMTDKSDLYIMDKINFEKLAPQEGLLPLDGDGFPDGVQVKSKTDEDTAERVYGVDLSGSSLLKALGIQGTSEFIAGIRGNAKHPEQAKAMIRHYLGGS